ncbi:hypothetical protein PIB30_040974 [Stylosanthes scabra]|uniref:Uncharacterized protein n=1 Tax=Stylosanthes scabra TaxID=79078 RepID=A0ABU6UG16_9FABA|nr:hypothetical protein [Stylosanthes scabra]
MPSASRRRKIAAKIKKAQSNSMINPPPLGKGELESQDNNKGNSSPIDHDNGQEPVSDAESVNQVPDNNVKNDLVKGGNEEAYDIVTESDAQSNESSEAENVSLDEPKTKEHDNEEHSDDSKNPADSENQPLVESMLMMQKTSWWSCCGLFEVLQASNH